MIRFACPGCASTFTVDDSKAGKVGKCPKCQSQFQIPKSDASAAVESPPVAPTAPPPVVQKVLPPPPPAALPAAAPSTSVSVEIAPCPKCSARLTVGINDLGVDVECPYCKTVYKAARSDALVPVPAPADDLASMGDGDDEPPPSKHRDSKTSKRSRRDDDDDDDRPLRRSRRDDDDDDDDRPLRRSRRDEDDDKDEDDRPSRRSRRVDDDDDRPSRRSRRDNDDDDRPSRRGRSIDDRPPKVGAISGMLLGGGIWAVLWALGMGGFSVGFLCLWPGTYFELVVGILCIIRGAQQFNDRNRLGAPRTHYILLIITIINGDVVNLVLGIVGLVFLSDNAVQRYFERWS